MRLEGWEFYDVPVELVLSRGYDIGTFRNEERAAAAAAGKCADETMLWETISQITADTLRILEPKIAASLD